MPPSPPRREDFSRPSLPEGFFWLNPPARYQLGNGLEIYTDRDTDFWQGTHYGFRRDDGHALLTWQTGDFSLQAQVEFQPRQQYDQCGLLVRVDAGNWIKLSTEYEDEQHSRLGSVVTNLGYSDWATQDIASSRRRMAYRIQRRGPDFLLEHALDGQAWQQLRVAHLHRLAPQLAVGVYACSPTGQDFWCRFEWLALGPAGW